MSSSLSEAIPLPKDIPVVIFCGGLGTRLKEETTVIPKPMVSIGGRPILWHLLKYYSSYGFRHFILCLGYKSQVIRDYFQNALSADPGQEVSREWTISCVDTGDLAMTGARLKRVESYIRSDRFMLTYGDGLSNIELNKLLDFHLTHGKIGTVSGVHPPSRFGLLRLEGDCVVEFSEKPQTELDYINGGFFIFEKKFFSYVQDNDQCILEREPLERLAKDGQLMAYLHKDYWQCMDTLRDKEQLEKQWRENPLWKRWES